MTNKMRKNGELIRNMGHSLRSPLVKAINFVNWLSDEPDLRLAEHRVSIDEVQRLLSQTSDSLGFLLDLLWLEAQVSTVAEISIFHLLDQSLQRLASEFPAYRNHLDIDVPDYVCGVKDVGLMELAIRATIRMFLSITADKVWISAVLRKTAISIRLQIQPEVIKAPVLPISEFIKSFGETHAVALFVSQRAMSHINGTLQLFGTLSPTSNRLYASLAIPYLSTDGGTK